MMLKVFNKSHREKATRVELEDNYGLHIEENEDEEE